MRYWDSSALVTLFVEQTATSKIRELYASDAAVVTWTLSEIEMYSALARLDREGAFDNGTFQLAVERLTELWKRVDAVSALDTVKTRARRLLRVHSLGAADALQLGAAFVVAQDDPSLLSFVCLDERLAVAARREGFTVVP